jgi:hypothetical protein
MPFDGLGFQGYESFKDGNHLPTVWRRVTNALALMWPWGRVARRYENRLLREKVEAAIVPELLRAARDLISSEERWVQGHLRTRDGRLCAMGAIMRVSAVGPGRHFRKPAVAHLLTVARQRGFSAVERMNDSSTHAEVLAAFDEAIRVSERIAAEQWDSPRARCTGA